MALQVAHFDTYLELHASHLKEFRFKYNFNTVV